MVARTGVPASTIHHYRRTGQIPPPQRQSANRFVYDQRHVDAVLAVRAQPAAEQHDCRERIVAAAIEAFKTRSYAEVSVSDIAEASHMAKGNVYRYFESKEALLNAAIEALLDDTTDRFQAALDSLGRGRPACATIPRSRPWPSATWWPTSCPYCSSWAPGRPRATSPAPTWPAGCCGRWPSRPGGPFIADDADGEGDEAIQSRPEE